MEGTVRDVMTPEPLTLMPSATLKEAACAMRDQNIGDVVVLDHGRLYGILTDRDIVVRGLAEDRDPQRTSVGEICSRQLVSIGPDQNPGEAVRLMREHAIRRLPVQENGRVVGLISLGDLAMDFDPESALADISAAPPNV